MNSNVLNSKTWKHDLKSRDLRSLATRALRMQNFNAIFLNEIPVILSIIKEIKSCKKSKNKNVLSHELHHMSVMMTACPQKAAYTIAASRYTNKKAFNPYGLR